MDPAIFASGSAVLGICYGQQLMAHLLGGKVRKGRKGEYGQATFDLGRPTAALFRDAGGRQQIWMSHRDTVEAVPAGFRGARRRPKPVRLPLWQTTPGASTASSSIPKSSIPATGGRSWRISCSTSARCEKDWDPRHRVAAGRRANPGSRGRPQRVLLRERRRRFDCRLHACVCRRLARIA